MTTKYQIGEVLIFSKDGPQLEHYADTFDGCVDRSVGTKCVIEAIGIEDNYKTLGNFCSVRYVDGMLCYYWEFELDSHFKRI